MSVQKVYLIHGLMGSRYEFRKINRALTANGFSTDFFSYKSRTDELRSVAEKLYKKVKEDNVSQVTFVTHSMGGLVLRAMCELSDADKDFPLIFRVVMIAPPNQGAVSANTLYKNKFFRWIMGVNLKHICPSPDALSRTLPVPKIAEVGIIAGVFKNDNDGEVKVEETKLGTEKDFVTVKAHHLYILQNTDAVHYTVNFLKKGTF